MFQPLTAYSTPDQSQPTSADLLFLQLCRTLNELDPSAVEAKLDEILQTIQSFRESNPSPLSEDCIVHLAEGCIILINSDFVGDQRVVEALNVGLTIIAHSLEREINEKSIEEISYSEQTVSRISTLTVKIFENVPELCIANSASLSQLIRFSAARVKNAAESLELIKSLAKAIDRKIFHVRPEIVQECESVIDSVIKRFSELNSEQARVFLEKLAEIEDLTYPVSTSLIGRTAFVMLSKIQVDTERLNAALPILNKFKDPNLAFAFLAKLLQEVACEEAAATIDTSLSTFFQTVFLILPRFNRTGCFLMFRFLFSYAKKNATTEKTFCEIISGIQAASLTQIHDETKLDDVFDAFQDYIDLFEADKPDLVEFAITGVILKYFADLTSAKGNSNQIFELRQKYCSILRMVLIKLFTTPTADTFAKGLALAILRYAKTFPHQKGSTEIVELDDDSLREEVLMLITNSHRTSRKPGAKSPVQQGYLLKPFLEDALIQAAELASARDSRLLGSILDFAKSVDKISPSIQARKPFQFLLAISKIFEAFTENRIHVAMFLLKSYHAIASHSFEESFHGAEVNLEELGSMLSSVIRFSGELSFVQELVFKTVAKIQPSLTENSDGSSLKPDGIVKRVIGAVAILAHNRDISDVRYLNEQIEEGLDQLLELLSSLDDIGQAEWIFSDLRNLLQFALPRFKALSEKAKRSICNLFVWVNDVGISFAYDLIFGAAIEGFWFGEFGRCFHKYRQPSRITPEDLVGLCQFFDYLFTGKAQIDFTRFSVKDRISLMDIASRVLMLAIYLDFWGEDSIKESVAQLARILMTKLLALNQDNLLGHFEKVFEQIVGSTGSAIVQSWGKIRHDVIQLVFFYYILKRLDLIDEAKEFARTIGPTISWLANKIITTNFGINSGIASQVGSVATSSQQAFYQCEENKLNRIFGFIIQLSDISSDLEGDHKEVVQNFLKQAVLATRADRSLAVDLSSLVNREISTLGYYVKVIEGEKFGTVTVDLLVKVYDARGENIFRFGVDVDGPSHTGFKIFTDRLKGDYLLKEYGLPIYRITLEHNRSVNRRNFMAEKIVEFVKEFLAQREISQGNNQSSNC